MASLLIKIQNFKEYMGYIGYQSDKDSDRPKLYVLGVYPLKRKKDGFQFGYTVVTKSIGSGIETRWTVRKGVYEKNPIKENDIIFCQQWDRNERGYFTMLKYIRCTV